MQLVEDVLSPEYSGFANPLYNQDDEAVAAAATAGPGPAAGSDRDRRPTVKSAFKPASDDSGNDTLQLVVRDGDD